MSSKSISRPPSHNQTSIAAEPSTFLFVNDTGGTGGPSSYKHGNRHDVRAHVRKVNAKQFGITHKHPRKRSETLLKYAPLTKKDAETRSSKEVEHDETCSLSVSGTGQRLSTNSISSPEGRTLVKITDSHCTTPLQSKDSPQRTEEQSELPVYCKACGALLNKSGLKQRLLSNKRFIAPIESTWEKSTLVKILGSGRIDPFSALPMEQMSAYSQELLDHAINYALPGLWPDQAPRGEPNLLSKAWFNSSLCMPLLFHALVYSGSNHLDYMRYSNIFPNAAKPLSHKLIVIQKLNEALSDPKQATRDEIILAILILASQEVFMTKKARRNPFNSPLQSLGWLNVYGNFKFVPQHTKAVADIVSMRGGLEAIELHGLADIIASGDVLSATNSIAKPGWPKLRRHADLITAMRVWAISPPWPLIQVQASAFWSLRSYGVTDSMLEVFDSIGALTLAIDVHLQGKPFGQYLGIIHRTRTAIQHSLLSLPTQDEFRPSTEEGEMRNNVYECSRLSALIFGVAVVYPVPNSYNVLQELVKRLQIALAILDIRTCGSHLDGVLLWILVLGGIAALDKPERILFASQLCSLVGKTKKYDWRAIEDILESFLWLESACGQGGRMLWDEAMAGSWS